MGGIVGLARRVLAHIEFQVVPPCGGHPNCWSSITRARCFKSCPRVGGISARHGNGRWHAWFKSCPRVGGIRYLFSRRRYLRSFKSCPRVGGILLGMHQLNLRMLGFKSCPRVGGIAFGCHTNTHCPCFKSCPRVGGICNCVRQYSFLVCFKSCPRVGGIAFKSVLNFCLSEFQVVPPCGGHRFWP